MQLLPPTVVFAVKKAIDLMKKTSFKKAINHIDPETEKITNSFFITPLNSDENSLLREEKRKENIRKFHKEKWKKDGYFEFNNDLLINDDKDVQSVMNRRDYKKNLLLQKKVEAYFKRKYPGPVKYG